MPVWFTALETHGPFPGPPPARNADSYLADGDGGGGSTYGGGNSPRSVYGGSTFGSKAGHGRSPSKGGSGVMSVTGAGGGGAGAGTGTVGSTALHRRMDSNVSVKSGLGLNRSGGATAG